MKVSGNIPCPCGSAAKLKRCCGGVHRGRPAPPRALMRARYCAYAIGLVEFLIETTHPDGPLARTDSGVWKAELVEYCRQTEFAGLKILGDTLDENGTRATVTFRADLQQDGRAVGFTERSLFVRDGVSWKYYSGELLDVPC